MIIAANFKMTHTRKETANYLKVVDEFIQKEKISNRAIVFPPFTALDNYNYKNITIGAQNGYHAKDGSFTGEIGLNQLLEFNISTILLGHSERRHILGESQEFIAKKFEFYKESGFEIIYCIGEPLEIKQKGIDAIMEYNKSQLVGIDLEYQKLIVAYEPVWAIGTGISATSNDIKEIHAKLREIIKKPILYGGSVKLNNIKEILQIPNVDGVLVGTASWKVEDFCEMLRS